VRAGRKNYERNHKQSCADDGCTIGSRDKIGHALARSGDRSWPLARGCLGMCPGIRAGQTIRVDLTSRMLGGAPKSFSLEAGAAMALLALAMVAPLFFGELELSLFILSVFGLCAHIVSKPDECNNQKREAIRVAGRTLASSTHSTNSFADSLKSASLASRSSRCDLR
jgi:hypothetical protein